MRTSTIIPTVDEVLAEDASATAETPSLDNSQFHFDYFVRDGRRTVRCINRRNKKSIEVEDRRDKLPEIERWMESQKGEKSMATWIRCSEQLPPVDQIVETKIDDATGCRNEQKLKRHQRSPETRSLWFLPDGSMYVYYEPTHWRNHAAV